MQTGGWPEVGGVASGVGCNGDAFGGTADGLEVGDSKEGDGCEGNVAVAEASTGRRVVDNAVGCGREELCVPQAGQEVRVGMGHCNCEGAAPWVVEGGGGPSDFSVAVDI